MGKVVYLLSLTLLCSISVYCQNDKIIYDEYGTIYTLINDSVIIYHTKKGEKYEVRLNQIYFMDGMDKLKEYLRKEYHQTDDSDDYYRVFFFMLFDNKLRLKEIRGVVLPLNQYTESRKKRVKQYMVGLKKTKSKWKKKTNQKWYVYCFSFATD